MELGNFAIGANSDEACSRDTGHSFYPVMPLAGSFRLTCGRSFISRRG
ncbi:hypothetical protein [Paracoccus sp. (in: a-proteobacteria)]|nr:hypothetical protein [Paracoccus sp. (in: a-proteobacteria)]